MAKKKYLIGKSISAASTVDEITSNNPKSTTHFELSLTISNGKKEVLFDIVESQNQNIPLQDAYQTILINFLLEYHFENMKKYGPENMTLRFYAHRDGAIWFDFNLESI